MITTSCIEHLARLFGIKLDKLDTEIAGAQRASSPSIDSVACSAHEFGTRLCMAADRCQVDKAVEFI